jgi:glc operon protein GlcG
MGRQKGKEAGRPAAPGAILVLAVGLVGGAGFATAVGAGAPAMAQEPGPSTGRVIADIRDRAGLFSAGSIAAAQRELERVARQSGASIVIETVDSLEGEPADRFAVNFARRSGIRGIFILAARKEHKLEVLGSGRYREILTDTHRRSIVDAFSEGFRRQDYNEGLRRGVAELVKVLESARPVAASSPHPPVPEARSGLSTEAAAMAFGPRAVGDSPLVARNQVRLTLAGARAIVAGAEAKAQSMGWKMNIAVVDDGGHLIAFERMEGARPASVYTALTKATTAATMRQPSGPFPPGTTNPDPLLNISLQTAAMASGGKVTTLSGGVPVVVDGQVIGGVGVGGGSGEQDAQVARAGIQAFTDQLEKPAARAGEDGPQGNPPPNRPNSSNRVPAGNRGDSDF